MCENTTMIPQLNDVTATWVVEHVESAIGKANNPLRKGFY